MFITFEKNSWLIIPRLACCFTLHTKLTVADFFFKKKKKTKKKKKVKVIPVVFLSLCNSPNKPFYNGDYMSVYL